MSDKSAKVIISLIGVAGLILYGYLLFMSDISVENQKYTVLAASIGVLYPLISLTDNEFFIENKWKALGAGFAGLCIILIAGYASKVDTQDGLVWDFVNAITTDGYRYFYFFLLVVANICPLVSKKIAVWLSPFTIGVMIPVILASLLLLALIVAGLSLLGAYGKSNKGTSSWSSIFSSPSSTNSNTNKERISASSLEPKKSPSYVPHATFRIVWRHNSQPLTYNADFDLPVDATVSDFERKLKKMHGGDATIVSYRRGNDPTVYLE